jgi:hypothetical protein
MGTASGKTTSIVKPLAQVNRDASFRLSDADINRLTNIRNSLPPGDLADRQAINDALQGKLLSAAERAQLANLAQLSTISPAGRAALYQALQADATHRLLAQQLANSSLLGKNGDLLSNLGSALGSLASGLGGGGRGDRGGDNAGGGDDAGSGGNGGGSGGGAESGDATPRADAADDDSQGDEESAPLTKFDRRYLRVKNDTKEKLAVFVQYETATETQGWSWFPKAPGQDQAVTYTLAPGQELDLAHQDWTINARRVRLWAQGQSGAEFNEFRDQDLWLVDMANGERAYQAPEGETFAFSFAD